MNLKKSSRTRWWVVLAAGVFSLLLLVAFVYEMLRAPGETLSLSNPGVQPFHLTEFLPAEKAIPEIDIKQLSESLEQALDSRFDEWDQRKHKVLEEDRLAQMQTFEKHWKGLGEKIETQSSKLQGMGQKLRLLENGMNRLLAALEDEALQVSTEPAFTFRGVEIWHGQTYALLEHQGRILPARQGESRLGWRIHTIDRDGQKLHVSDGMTEFVLEEQ